MKNRTFTFILLMMISLASFAEQKFNAEYAGIRYKFVVTGGNEVTLVGLKGKKNFEIYECNLPTTVKHGGVEYTVTGIGKNAFKEAYKVKKIIFPKQLKTIGKGAFIKCIRLKSVEFPETLESIGDRAFFGDRLSEVFLPESIQSIGKEAFCAASPNLVDISTIKHLDVPETCQTIGKHAFSAFKNGVSGWQATDTEIMRLPETITPENCEKYGLTKASLKRIGREEAPKEETDKDAKAEKKSKKSKKNKKAAEEAPAAEE